MKSTKKALLMSALSLLLCCSMLIGTTFAWFTDEVKSGNNIIAAGNLDIELYHSDSAVKNEKVNGGTKLFDDVSSQLWEPGAVAYEVLTVVNEGTLALKYNLAFHALNATVVNGKSLANVLKIAVVDASKLTSREAAIAAGAGEWTALNSFDLPGVLEAEESETYGIVIYWEPSSNDNDFNMNNENQGKILSVELGVHLTATQKMSEEDSFGDDYDKDAEPVLVKNAADLAAALTANEEYIYVILGNDIDLPRNLLIGGNSGDEYKMGGADTKAINIDLNGRKLNITTSYWSVLGTVNPATVVTFANGTMTSSQATGTWNSYDLAFASGEFVFENVTFEKAIALETNAVLKNVTINETHDYYAMWISAEGQTVEIDGLTINSNGRGIKIDEQYVDAEKVTLKVSNATFNTNKKAAIMVKSEAGADIILDKIDISNTSDPLHAVWVDEDSAAYSDKVNVIGGKKFSEADVISSATGLNDAIASGDTDIVLGAGTYTLPTLSGKDGITIVGAEGVVIGGENTATGFGGNFGQDTTIKNLNFIGSTNGVRYSYAQGGTTTFENCTFAGDSTYGFHIDESEGATFIFNNCTFSGFNAFAGDLEKVIFNNCTFLNNGNYGHTNIWSVAELNNCTFGEGTSIGPRGDSASITIDGVAITGVVKF